MKKTINHERKICLLIFGGQPLTGGLPYSVSPALCLCCPAGWYLWESSMVHGILEWFSLKYDTFHKKWPWYFRGICRPQALASFFTVAMIKTQSLLLHFLLKEQKTPTCTSSHIAKFHCLYSRSSKRKTDHCKQRQ